MLVLLSNKGGVSLQANGDLLPWNLPQRWGLTTVVPLTTGWEAVRDADANSYIFVNNAAAINSPHLLRFQLPTIDPPPTRRLWTLNFRATLTHAFEVFPPVTPYIGDGAISWQLTLSNGNRYVANPGIIVQGFPGESNGFVWVNTALVIDTATDFVGGAGIPNTLELNFTHTGFVPGFLIDRLILTGA